MYFQYFSFYRNNAVHTVTHTSTIVIYFFLTSIEKIILSFFIFIQINFLNKNFSIEEEFALFLSYHVSKYNHDIIYDGQVPIIFPFVYFLGLVAQLSNIALRTEKQCKYYSHKKHHKTTISSKKVTIYTSMPLRQNIVVFPKMLILAFFTFLKLLFSSLCNF